MRRRLGNGDLMVMYEDDLESIPGYTRKNKNHYIQNMPPCQLRDRVKCSKCRNPIYKNVCTIGRPLDCVECEERVE